MKISPSARLLQIDVARGIGIILVVLGHNWLLINNYPALKQAIYLFHVPLFFFLSGLVFKPQENTKLLAFKRANALLKPYLVVLLGYELYRLLTGKSDSLQAVWGILYGTGQSISLPPLWFLPHLFLVVIVSNFLIRRIHSKTNHYSSNILIFGLLFVGVTLITAFKDVNISGIIGFGKPEGAPIGLPLSVDFLMISSAYFIAGYFYSNFVKSISSSALFIVPLVAMFIAILLFFQPNLDLNYRVYDNPISTTIAAFIGILMTMAISKMISENIDWLSGVLGFIGSGSLFVLIFHGPIQGMLAYKFNSWVSGYPFLSIFLSAGLAISAACLLFRVANFYPKLRSILN